MPDPSLFALARGDGFAAVYNFGDRPADIDLAVASGHRDWMPLADGRGRGPESLQGGERFVVPPLGLRWSHRRGIPTR